MTQTAQRHHLGHGHYGGYRPSPPHIARVTADPSGIKVLPEVDPRPHMQPVYNQMQLGSCTANATCSAFRYDRIVDGKDCGDLSRLDCYWLERQREGTLGQGDTGAMGSDAFWVAQHHGLCDEADWPYDPSKYSDPSYFDPASPPTDAAKDARKFVLRRPYATPPLTINGFKAVLSNNQTICFGFQVYESFETQQVASTGIVPIPQVGEQVLGGHEVMIVGYLKSEPQYALGRNSWSTSWGISGYFLMPWAMLLDPSICGDWTTIQRPAGK